MGRGAATPRLKISFEINDRGHKGIKPKTKTMHIRKRQEIETIRDRAKKTAPPPFLTESRMMNASTDFPDLAPIPRRAFVRRSLERSAPRRALVSVAVEVEVFDAASRSIVTETSIAFVRELPAALAGLSPRLRDAALAYAKAIEEVEAGGATDPEARPSAKTVTGGAKEGRQFHAIRHVRHLRAIETAIGVAVVDLGRRKGEVEPVCLPVRSIVRAIALDGLSVAALLASVRLGRNARRQARVLRVLVNAAERIADALGIVDPVAEDEKAGR